MSEAENPFEQLKAQINADPEYAWAWFCNLSVPFTDVGVDHRLADSGAALVMAQMFGFDITADVRFQGSKSGAQAYFEARVAAEHDEAARHPTQEQG